jgi:hypothetical protein
MRDGALNHSRPSALEKWSAGFIDATSDGFVLNAARPNEKLATAESAPHI